MALVHVWMADEAISVGPMSRLSVRTCMRDHAASLARVPGVTERTGPGEPASDKHFAIIVGHRPDRPASSPLSAAT